jgi:hypothetical protein
LVAAAISFVEPFVMSFGSVRPSRTGRLSASTTTVNFSGDPDAGNFYVFGVPALRRFEMAVTSWAGANGLGNMMLFGTLFEAQSAMAAPLI